MKITFPTNFEKKHLLLLVKKQNYILFLGMKFAFIHPKIHEIFSQIYFEIRRLNLFKLNLLISRDDLLNSLITLYLYFPYLQKLPYN